MLLEKGSIQGLCTKHGQNRLASLRTPSFQSEKFALSAYAAVDLSAAVRDGLAASLSIDVHRTRDVCGLPEVSDSGAAWSDFLLVHATQACCVGS